jgi:hypothetical protein
MELDDLKEAWKKTNLKKTNTDIMELIQHKSYGPLNALKREFIKQIRLMLVMPIILILTNIQNVDAVLTSIMFWSYVALCLAVIVVSYFNYRTVSKMGMDRMVRSNLEEQISVVETRLKWYQKGVRIALLFFIMLTEVVPYFQHYRMLDKWHSLSPLIRFGTYAGFLMLQYFVSSAVCHRRFGSHLAYLKNLVKEME